MLACPCGPVKRAATCGNLTSSCSHGISDTVDRDGIKATCKTRAKTKQAEPFAGTEHVSASASTPHKVGPCQTPDFGRNVAFVAHPSQTHHHLLSMDTIGDLARFCAQARGSINADSIRGMRKTTGTRQKCRRLNKFEGDDACLVKEEKHLEGKRRTISYTTVPVTYHTIRRTSAKLFPSKPTANLSRVAGAREGAAVMFRVEGQAARDVRGTPALPSCKGQVCDNQCCVSCS